MNLALEKAEVAIKMHNSLSEFADKYDYFIIDLWGVLHDGQAAYPKAIAALESLRKRSKKIILLSNAPRRAVKAKETLDRLGFAPDLYDAILTSGEVTFEYLKNDRTGGKKYYYIGPEKDEDILNGLEECQQVKCPADADFALNTGFNHFGDGMETKQPETEECLAARIPMICANPDRVVVRQTGEVMLCAGLLGEFYEANGGEVIWFGKPYESVYEKCLEIFGITKSESAKICAIGDSIHTDIAGANNSGISSTLVAGGILSKKLGINFGELPTLDNLEKTCIEEGDRPTYIIPEFLW